jgi:hypothetical protein
MKRMLVTIALGLFSLSNFTFAQTNWVTSSSIPADAIVAGYESNGTPFYVCHGGTNEGYGLQPGKYRSGFSGCDFGYGGQEIYAPDFQFLVSSWQSASNGSIPSNAIVGGCEEPLPGQGFCGASLYYCRASIPFHNGLQPGKIERGFSGCHVPYGGQELIEPSYQVFVALNPAMPLSSVGASNGNVPFGSVRAGTDTDGHALYMCSARYSGGLHPGKLRPEFGACNIAYGGREVQVQSYAVEVPNWLAFPPGYRIDPLFDFPTGHESDGTPLYTCRDYFRSGLHPGKYLRSIGHCNFGWGGVEQTQTTGFDVLTDWNQIIPKPE